MHIAFLTTEYPHQLTDNGGGIGTSIKNLAKGLSNLGHKVTVFVYGGASDNEFYDNETQIIVFKATKYRLFSWYFYHKEVEKRIAQYDFDIIEIPDWYGTGAFMRFKRPSVIKFHGTETYFAKIANRKISPVLTFLEKINVTHRSGYIGVSNYVLTQSKGIFNLNVINSNNSIVIHNGIDCSLFASSISSQKVAEGAPSTLLYFGTLVRKKGLLELPHIFNLIVEKEQNVELLLVGGDTIDYVEGKSTWSVMQSMFSEVAISKVKYLGKQPYERMREIIAGATVCLFPSFAEAFPVSWLEAMIMAKPIVGSNMPWAKEAIEDGKSGMLVNPVEHEAYANAVLSLLANTDFANQLGSNAQKRVLEQFAIENIARKHVEFYRSLQ